MQLQSFSIKQVRSNFASIVDQVAIAETSIIITKFGKPRAMIVPIAQADQATALKKKKLVLGFSGVWRNRKDLTDSVEFAKKLRQKASVR